MKNSRWSRLTAWLVMLVMVLTFSVLTAVSLAEEGTEEVIPPAEETQKDTVSDTVISSIVLSAPLEELEDVTANADFSFVGADGKTVSSPADMDPNQDNTMRISITGLSTEEDPTKKTVLGVTLPENIQLTSAGVSTIGGEVTGSLGENGMLELRWIGEKADQVTVEIPVIPHIPAGNDLSGSYILGTLGNDTYHKAMLGFTTFPDAKNKNRGRINAYAFQEKDGRIITSTLETPVWQLTHVSGDYYTVYSVNAGQYLKIVSDKNGITLEDADYDSAQKILLNHVQDGYYSFIYNEKSLNNSSHNPVNGFASYTIETGDNAILKLYPVSALTNEPYVDFSGTWAIANITKFSMLSDETTQGGRLTALSANNNNGVLIPQDNVVYWTFEHIGRNWYTIQSEHGYLNISSNGVYVSDEAQNILVRSNDNFNTIVLATGDTSDDYMLKLASNVYTIAKNTFSDETKIVLKRESEIASGGSNLVFNANGGTVNNLPISIAGEAGDRITLPDMEGSKDGGSFIGWSEDENFYSKLSSVNHTYRVLRKPGTEYRLAEGVNTLYAVYDSTSRDVRFGIRVDGVIQDEPSDNKKDAYKGHFTLNDVRKVGHWVIDIRSTGNVNGYYLENNVTAALTRVPTAEEIVDALKKEGNISFDPETQYVHWYVMKSKISGSNVTWHIDGVIRSKKAVSVTYDMNVDNTAERSKIKDLPGAYQVPAGTQILIGSAENSKTIKIPTREGYVFIGWNTEADGSGTTYSGGEYMRLTQNLHLFAQWKDVSNGKLAITITSDWPQGKPAYDGTRITLTANLTGFENKDYTLQWQYSDDNRETWNDQPGENGMTMTYEMSKTTANYIWRVIAKDVTDKK